MIGLLMEYEEILLGKREDFSSVYLKKRLPQEDVEELFRYVFGSLLEWTPSQVRDYSSKKLLSLLHLEKPYRYLVFPPELDRDRNVFYLGHLLYPDRIKYTRRDMVISIYQRVLSGEMTKFPKTFFTGEDGRANMITCMKYVLNSYFDFHSAWDMYSYFASRKKGMAFMRRYHMTVPCSELFGDPLTCLHECLPDDEARELYYYYFQFRNALEGYKSEQEEKKGGK